VEFLYLFFFFFFFFFESFNYCLRYKLPYADRSKIAKTSTYSPSRIPRAKTLRPCLTPKHPVLWVETTEERTGLNTMNHKTSTVVQPIGKTLNPNSDQPEMKAKKPQHPTR